MSGVEKPCHSTLITSVDAGTGKVPLFLVPSYGSHIFVFAGCLKQIAQLSLNWQDSEKSVWAVTCMRIGTVYSFVVQYACFASRLPASPTPIIFSDRLMLQLTCAPMLAEVLLQKAQESPLLRQVLSMPHRHHTQGCH